MTGCHKLDFLHFSSAIFYRDQFAVSLVPRINLIAILCYFVSNLIMFVLLELLLSRSFSDGL